MVRYLVGTMIAIGTNKFSEDTFVNLLQNPKKNVRIFKAPPQGLILEKVAYE
jgi:tRNA pseudouridine38-40 synthase